jgi:UDP-N-acetylmuramoyl-tripeptide--D-alanyl-D-alanine ligase
MELVVAPSGARILNDAYNANPLSMLVALEALADLEAERHTAVLGPMAELGVVSDAEHRRVAERAMALGVRLVSVDTSAYGGEVVVGIDGALAALGGLDAGDAVLVKASRVAGLERLAQRLVDG